MMLSPHGQDGDIIELTSPHHQAQSFSNTEAGKLYPPKTADAPIGKQHQRGHVSVKLAVVSACVCAIGAVVSYKTQGIIIENARASSCVAAQQEARTVSGRLRLAFAEPIQGGVLVAAMMGALGPSSLPDNTSSAAFHAVAGSQIVARNMNNMAWCPLVFTTERATWEAAMSTAFNTTVAISDFSALANASFPASPARDYYLPMVDYAWPYEGPLPIAVDIRAEPVRRAVTDAAMETRSVVLSEPTISAVTHRTSYIAALPSFRTGTTAPSQSQRYPHMPPPNCTAAHGCPFIPVMNATTIHPKGVVLVLLDFAGLVPAAIEGAFTGLTLDIVDVGTSPVCYEALPPISYQVLGTTSTVVLAGGVGAADGVVGIVRQPTACTSPVTTPVFSGRVVHTQTPKLQIVTANDPSNSLQRRPSVSSCEFIYVFPLAGRWIQIYLEYNLEEAGQADARVAIGASMACTAALLLFSILVVLWQQRRASRAHAAATSKAEATALVERGYELALASGAHELRNPLHVITSLLQLITLRVEDVKHALNPEAADTHSLCNSAEQHKLVESLSIALVKLSVANDRAELMHRLITDFTCFAHASDARELFSPASCDIAATAAALFRTHVSLFDPATALSLCMVGDFASLHLDSLRWQQIISNGLTNACKHCIGGRVQLVLQLLQPNTALNGRKDTLLVAVLLDNGHNVKKSNDIVPAAHPERSLEAPVGLAALVRGSGLGLVISARLAKAMGGTLDAFPRATVDGVAGMAFTLVVPVGTDGQPSLFLGSDHSPTNAPAPGPQAGAARSCCNVMNRARVAPSPQLEHQQQRKWDAHAVAQHVIRCSLDRTPRRDVVQLNGVNGGSPLSDSPHFLTAENPLACGADFRPQGEDVRITCTDSTSVEGAQTGIHVDATCPLETKLGAWLECPIRERSHSSQHPLPPSKPLHILYADDDRMNRILMVKILERLGMTCDTVSDGDEVAAKLVEARMCTIDDAAAAGLPWSTVDVTSGDVPPAKCSPSHSVAAGRPYDAIILDVVMARTDGTDICRALRRVKSLPAQYCILAVTGNSYDHAVRTGAGFTSVLSKPCSVSDLHTALQHDVLPGSATSGVDA